MASPPGSPISTLMSSVQKCTLLRYFLKVGGGARAMTQWLRALPVLPEDASLIPTTHTRQLTTSYNYNSLKITIPAHMLTPTYRHKIKKKSAELFTESQGKLAAMMAQSIWPSYHVHLHFNVCKFNLWFLARHYHNHVCLHFIY